MKNIKCQLCNREPNHTTKEVFLDSENRIVSAKKIFYCYDCDVHWIYELGSKDRVLTQDEVNEFLL